MPPFIMILVFVVGVSVEGQVTKKIRCPTIDCVKTVLSYSHESRNLKSIRVWPEKDFFPVDMGQYGTPPLIYEQYN